MSSSDFSDYCRKVREDNKCEFYHNSRKNSQLTVEAKALVLTLAEINPFSTEEMIEHSSGHKMCPYEISIGLAKDSSVIITDYYYFFNPRISATFLTKLSKDYPDLIVVVDEAHSLPERIKNLASETLTSMVLVRAIKEAKKFNHHDCIDYLNKIQDVLLRITDALKPGQEILVSKEDFSSVLSDQYEEISAALHIAGDEIRELQRVSFVSSVARFLDSWTGTDEGFVRIASLRKGIRQTYASLSYRCLDPSVITKSFINNTHSTILMSGTLSPTSMYKELLGLDRTRELVFDNPFPKKNRLNLIVPKTTTKFTERSTDQYSQIAIICNEIVQTVPGNCVLFFPSYLVLGEVKRYLEDTCPRTLFVENPGLLKHEKQSLLDRFKDYKDIGAVLMAVIGGSFSEGIDLPGDLLKGVVVVGLPLSPPDLETKSLIGYYDEKFQKGWDYGYLFPAFNKCLQSAGRCIRSESDRGIVVFLDQRYIWSNYFRCFPEDWQMETTLDYKKRIEQFFKE
jgi:DNA excision repair protein ERCC-2